MHALFAPGLANVKPGIRLIRQTDKGTYTTVPLADYLPLVAEVQPYALMHMYALVHMRVYICQWVQFADPGCACQANKHSPCVPVLHSRGLSIWTSGPGSRLDSSMIPAIHALSTPSCKET